MATSNTFTLTRTVNAPRELVWRVWTEAEHLAKWFGPQGLTTKVHKLELKPHGVFLYSMHSADGFEMWGKWVFRAIEAPHRIELIQSFSNAECETTRYPENEAWPLYMLSTTTFSEAGEKTIIKLEWSTYEATAEEAELFNNSFDDMTNGWNGTFEQLDEYLKAISGE